MISVMEKNILQNIYLHPVDQAGLFPPPIFYLVSFFLVFIFLIRSYYLFSFIGLYVIACKERAGCFR
jgi:hypothetical protein